MIPTALYGPSLMDERPRHRNRVPGSIMRIQD
ncbi:MAG: hypothetical protein K0R13_3631, partial [Propionibacteriaceae bacterium]|nr:hypothetical protein [Propionibacteriaceae bacterium]